MAVKRDLSLLEMQNRRYKLPEHYNLAQNRLATTLHSLDVACSEKDREPY
jgi:hypothetical protein